MKLWVLVGAFTVLTAPSAFALGAPHEPSADAVGVASPSGKKTCGERKQDDPAPRHEPMVQVQAPAMQTPPDPNAEAALVAQAQDAARRRRNGSMEAVPDALLLGGRGAL